MRKLLLVLAFALPLPTHAQLSAVVPETAVGEVAFANSGKPEAQAAFLRGMGLLHNFEYPRAAKAFQEAQAIDPSFAMAYWGEAMTHTHPIWFQQDADAARAVLQRLGKTTAERLAKAGTERERDYLRTLDVLYGEGTKNERDFLYADAMAALHARYPNDVDATAFYALALLGTAHEGRDFTIYMRAAALLEEVFPANSRHPGVLHYLIHAYDDPAHAPLGMRAARIYGSVAPDAGHALHMTSHIFIAMGMWDDVIDANRRAIRVVNRQREARSAPAADCGHYPTWLHYGLLQKGQDHEARKTLEACRASAFAEKYVSGGPGDSLTSRLSEYSVMRAHHIASSRELPSMEALTMPSGADAPQAQFTLVYGDVLAAARRKDAAALKAATEQLRSLQNKAVGAEDEGRVANPTARISAEVMVQEAEALQLILAGKRDEALKLLEQAAAAERSMPIEFGPPVVPKPATELLADQLLAAGRAAEAVAAYEQVLARTPGRRPTLEGLLLAQKAAGNGEAAEKTAKKLVPETKVEAPHVH
jgi:tetratricopeptide (TPR) repeat protein